MSLSATKETYLRSVASHKETLLSFKLIFSDLFRLIRNILFFSPNLAERIARYGKIRILIVCDENLGRSPTFVALLKNHIKRFGLEDYVEVISAGTDVISKQSDKKHGGGVHPIVGIVMGFIPDSNPQEHRAQQLNEKLVTPNTIIVALNDIIKISKRIKRKCYAVLDYGMDDPHDVGEGTLLERIHLLAGKEYFLALHIATILRIAFENNDLQIFQINDPMHR